MAYRKRIYTDQFPYHVSARSNNQEWFAIDPEICWRIFILNLLKVQNEYRFKVHSFVLMSNHYHLLCTTDSKYNLGQVMNRFQTEVSRDINGVSGRRNHVFGKRYHASLIKNQHHYFNVLKYIYRNPIEAKIVDNFYDYEFSTAHFLHSNKNLKIEISSPLGLDDVKISNEMCEWINRSNDFKINEIIRRGFKRVEFGVSYKNLYANRDPLLNNLPKNINASSE